MNFSARVFLLPRRVKQLVFGFADLFFLPLSIWLAVSLRYGEQSFTLGANDYAAAAVCVLVSIIIFATTGLYRAVVRYMGQQAILATIRGITISALVLALTMLLFRSGMPRSIPIIYWGIALFLIGGPRLLIRSSYHSLKRRRAIKVAVYGAGDSGRQLLNSLHQGDKFKPVALIDDDGALHGRVINGVRVYPFRKLKKLIAKKGITDILLALPTVGRERRREIIQSLESLSISVKTMPSFEELVLGTARVDDIHDVRVEDLLGRNAVAPNPRLLGRCIKNKVVMVTGAGGSIGSELCRQIIRNQPAELLLMDICEFNLYKIDRELQHHARDSGQAITVTPLLGSVQNRNHLESIFTEFGVQTVYHAAAYKHVPMVEYNNSEGVRNNVFGTYEAARAAVAAGVETFVLISTDKAVRPTNVMGASKRMAELILQGFANKQSRTRFCMVRFGNVLGSSGSVVPLFRDQIRNGGPVTVTHPDVVRYFMTIPEAAQLVLQAGSLGKGGDVFVLDMGDQVRIVDLAKRMIRLMGHRVRDADRPDGDIEIAFSGLRPGEKLYEELLVGDNVTGTEHPMIMRAEEDSLTEAVLDTLLARLTGACDSNDCHTIKEVLEEAVSGFKSSDGISDAIWKKRHQNGEPRLDKADNVVAMPAKAGSQLP